MIKREIYTELMAHYGEGDDEQEERFKPIIKDLCNCFSSTTLTELVEFLKDEYDK